MALKVHVVFCFFMFLISTSIAGPKEKSGQTVTEVQQLLNDLSAFDSKIKSEYLSQIAPTFAVSLLETGAIQRLYRLGEAQEKSKQDPIVQWVRELFYMVPGDPVNLFPTKSKENPAYYLDEEMVGVLLQGLLTNQSLSEIQKNIIKRQFHSEETDYKFLEQDITKKEKSLDYEINRAINDRKALEDAQARFEAFQKDVELLRSQYFEKISAVLRSRTEECTGAIPAADKEALIEIFGSTIFAEAETSSISKIEQPCAPENVSPLTRNNIEVVESLGKVSSKDCRMKLFWAAMQEADRRSGDFPKYQEIVSRLHSTFKVLGQLNRTPKGSAQFIPVVKAFGAAKEKLMPKEDSGIRIAELTDKIERLKAEKKKLRSPFRQEQRVTPFLTAMKEAATYCEKEGSPYPKSFATQLLIARLLLKSRSPKETFAQLLQAAGPNFVRDESGQSAAGLGQAKSPGQVFAEAVQKLGGKKTTPVFNQFSEYVRFPVRGSGKEVATADCCEASFLNFFARFGELEKRDGHVKDPDAKKVFARHYPLDPKSSELRADWKSFVSGRKGELEYLAKDGPYDLAPSIDNFLHLAERVAGMPSGKGRKRKDRLVEVCRHYGCSFEVKKKAGDWNQNAVVKFQSLDPTDQESLEITINPLHCFSRNTLRKDTTTDADPRSAQPLTHGGEVASYASAWIALGSCDWVSTQTTFENLVKARASVMPLLLACGHDSHFTVEAVFSLLREGREEYYAVIPSFLKNIPSDIATLHLLADNLAQFNYWNTAGSQWDESKLSVIKEIENNHFKNLPSDKKSELSHWISAFSRPAVKSWYKGMIRRQQLKIQK